MTDEMMRRNFLSMLLGLVAAPAVPSLGTPIKELPFVGRSFWDCLIHGIRFDALFLDLVVVGKLPKEVRDAAGDENILVLPKAGFQHSDILPAVIETKEILCRPQAGKMTLADLDTLEFVYGGKETVLVDLLLWARFPNGNEPLIMSLTKLRYTGLPTMLDETYCKVALKWPQDDMERLL